MQTSLKLISFAGIAGVTAKEDMCWKKMIETPNFLWNFNRFIIYVSS